MANSIENSIGKTNNFGLKTQNTHDSGVIIFLPQLHQ